MNVSIDREIQIALCTIFHINSSWIFSCLLLVYFSIIVTRSLYIVYIILYVYFDALIFVGLAISSNNNKSREKKRVRRREFPVRFAPFSFVVFDFAFFSPHVGIDIIYSLIALLLFPFELSTNDELFAPKTS